MVVAVASCGSWPNPWGTYPARQSRLGHGALDRPVHQAAQALEIRMSLRNGGETAHALPAYASALGWLLVAGCGGMAVYVPVFDRVNWEPVGTILTLAAAALVAAGLLMRGGSAERQALVLIVVGAIASGFFLIWTLVMPLLAVVLIVVIARQALNGGLPAANPAN